MPGKFETYEGAPTREWKPGDLVTVAEDIHEGFITQNHRMRLAPGMAYQVFGLEDVETSEKGTFMEMALLGPAGASKELVENFSPELLFGPGYEEMAVVPAHVLRKMAGAN